MKEFFDWFEHVYPYTNFHELNLDWCINTVKLLADTMKEFVTLNTIKYAEPIQWNITTQYEKNTVVIDPITGTAYISTQPVPAGAGLNNTDYWNVIFTLDVISANKNITLRDDANNTLATFESEDGDWLLTNGTLYKVLRHIDIGSAYVIDYNIERYTVELFIKDYISNLKTYIDTIIGDLEDLDTSDKTNVVSAINEVLTTISTLIGDLADLGTTDKDNIVDAINELVTVISNIADAIGVLQDLNTVDKTSLVNAINEVVGYCGDLDNLKTTDKTSLVNAINEIVTNKEWYDVSVDYTTDMGVAITNAINNGHKYIYIPAGEYTFQTTARVNNSDVIIRGAGKDSTILKSGNSLNSCLFICDTRDRENDLNNITFMNFTIDGESNTDPTQIKILFIASSNNSVNHEIVNPTLLNLKIKNSNGCLVNFDGGGALNRTENYWIKNAYVFNCESYNSGVKDVIGGGIHFTHSIMGLVEHCTVDNSGQECYTFDNYCRYMTIKDSYVGNNRGGAGALSIDLCEGFVVDNCIFDSHWSTSPTATARCGIKINDEGGASRGVIANCKIFNNTNGIIVNAPQVADYGVEVVEISNCIIGNLDNNGHDIVSNVTGEGRVSVHNCYGLFGNKIAMNCTAGTRSNFDYGYYNCLLSKSSPEVNNTPITFSVLKNDGFTIDTVNHNIVIPTTGVYEVKTQTWSCSALNEIYIKANGTTKKQVLAVGNSNAFTTQLSFTKGDLVTFTMSTTGTVASIEMIINYVGNI